MSSNDIELRFEVNATIKRDNWGNPYDLDIEVVGYSISSTVPKRVKEYVEERRPEIAEILNVE